MRRFGLGVQDRGPRQALGLPVVTSFSGRGLLAEGDAPLAGTYLGVAGAPEISGLVEGSDALLLLGVIISDTNFGVSAQQIDLRKTIQALDERVALGYHTYPQLPLGALVDGLLAQAPAPRRMPAFTAPIYPRGLVADDQPIVPNDIATASMI